MAVAEVLEHPEELPVRKRPARKAGDILDGDDRRIGRYLYLRRGDDELYEAFCDSWLRTYHNDSRFFITVDLETTGLDYINGEVLLVSVCADGRNAVVFRPQEFDLGPFKQVLETVPVNNHNIKFDLKWIYRHFHVEPVVYWDTMMAAQMGWAGAFPEKSYALDNVAKHLLHYKLTKDTRKGFIGRSVTDEFTDEEVEYAARDSVVTHLLVYPEKKRLKNMGLLQLWYDCELPLINILTRSEVAGCKVNLERLQEIYAEKEGELVELFEEIQGIYNALPNKPTCPKGQYNPASSKQVVDILQSVGVLVRNTEEVTLDDARQKHPECEILRKTIAFRALKSEISKYLKSWLSKYINPTTGCIHTNFKIYGTTTGRLACVAEGTLVDIIRRGNPRCVPIEDIQVGDLVNTHTGASRRVAKVLKQGKKEVWRLTTETGEALVATPDHLIRTKSAEWLQVRHLTVKDRVELGDGTFSKVARIEPLKTKRTCYDLVVEQDESFTAAGILVHNCSEPNMQNITGDYRSMIVAREGKVILSQDYSQYEFRACAAVTGEESLVQAFFDRQRLLPEMKAVATKYTYLDVDGFVKDVKKAKVQITSAEDELVNRFAATDVHVRNAAAVLSKDFKDVDYLRERPVGKTLGYALLYGAGPARIQDTLLADGFQVSFDDCKKFQASFLKQMPKVAKMILDTHRRVVTPVQMRDEQGNPTRRDHQAAFFVETFLGRKRFFNLPPKVRGQEYMKERAKAEREAVNFLFQGANADATKRAMVLLDERFQMYPEDRRPLLLLSVHDEIVTECPEDLVDEVAAYCEKVMVETGSSAIDHKVPIEVSRTVGVTWSK